MLRSSTTHPILRRLIIARQINMAHGAAVIGAWQIDDFPDEWIDAMRGFVDLPMLQIGRAKVDQHFAEWRANHPQYGKGRLH